MSVHDGPAPRRSRRRAVVITICATAAVLSLTQFGAAQVKTTAKQEVAAAGNAASAALSPEKPEDIRAHEALQLEAEANARAGRWDQAAKSYLELFKQAADPALRTTARQGYLNAAAHAFQDPKEDKARLLAAETELRAGRWKTAADKYLEALTNASDDGAKQKAAAGYDRAAQVITTPWWRWGTYVPPVWWVHNHPREAGLLLFALLVVVVGPLFFTGAPITDRLFRQLPPPIRPKFSGRASILAAAMLTDNAPVKLFAAQMPHCAIEVRRRWKRVGVCFLSGATTLLSVPGTLADQIAADIPNIKGMNIGAWAKWLLQVRQYFSWRVESQVGFAPDTAATPSEGRMHAYATLRWAWFTYDSYGVAPRARHALDFERASYAIAARVLGAAQPKRSA
jgi:hypothetical protein